MARGALLLFLLAAIAQATPSDPSEGDEGCQKYRTSGFVDNQADVLNGIFIRRGEINEMPYWSRYAMNLYWHAEREHWMFGANLGAIGHNAEVASNDPAPPSATWRYWGGTDWQETDVTIECIDGQDDSGELLELGDHNWDRVLSGDPYLVQFSAPWCGHCRRMEPTFLELAKRMQGRTYIGKVDCTANDRVRERYHIRAFPTIKLFFKGRVTEFQGARILEAFTTFLNEYKAFMDASVEEQATVYVKSYEWMFGSEPIRLILHELGIQYEETLYTEESWEMEQDAEAPDQGLGVLPVLNTKNVSISHGMAIARYLAREHDLYGTEDEFNAMVDTVMEHCEEFYGEYATVVHNATEDEFKSALAAFEGRAVEWVAYMSKTLERNRQSWGSSGRSIFIVGPALTIADMFAFDVLGLIAGLFPRILNSDPLVWNFFLSIGTRDNLNDYLSGQPTQRKRPTFTNSENARIGNAMNPVNPASNPFAHQ